MPRRRSSALSAEDAGAVYALTRKTPAPCMRVSTPRDHAAANRRSIHAARRSGDMPALPLEDGVNHIMAMPRR